MTTITRTVVIKNEWKADTPSQPVAIYFYLKVAPLYHGIKSRITGRSPRPKVHLQLIEL